LIFYRFKKYKLKWWY